MRVVQFVTALLPLGVLATPVAHVEDGSKSHNVEWRTKHSTSKSRPEDHAIRLTRREDPALESFENDLRASRPNITIGTSTHNDSSQLKGMSKSCVRKRMSAAHDLPKEDLDSFSDTSSMVSEDESDSEYESDSEDDCKF
jgi:hypothetical protein